MPSIRAGLAARAGPARGRVHPAGGAGWRLRGAVHHLGLGLGRLATRLAGPLVPRLAAAARPGRARSTRTRALAARARARAAHAVLPPAS